MESLHLLKGPEACIEREVKIPGDFRFGVVASLRVRLTLNGKKLAASTSHKF